MERAFKGVWIPKEIWLDNNLGWSEKLLLVEIDSLATNDECFATNSYFAEFFNLSERQISRLISSLTNKGYINVIINYKDGSKQILNRIITPCHGYGQKRRGGMDKNVVGGMDKNVVDNNININNTINNIIPPTPQGEEKEKEEEKKANKKEERKRIEHTKVHQYFVQNIPNEEIRSKVFTIMKHRSETERPITMTFAKVFLKNLEEFSCGIEAQKINILNMSIERGYTTIYNPKYLTYSNHNKYDNQEQSTPSYDLNYEEEFGSSDAYTDYLKQEIEKLNNPNKKNKLL